MVRDALGGTQRVKKGEAPAPHPLTALQIRSKIVAFLSNESDRANVVMSLGVPTGVGVQPSLLRSSIRHYLSQSSAKWPHESNIYLSWIVTRGQGRAGGVAPRRGDSPAGCGEGGEEKGER